MDQAPEPTVVLLREENIASESLGSERQEEDQSSSSESESESDLRSGDSTAEDDDAEVEELSWRLSVYRDDIYGNEQDYANTYKQNSPFADINISSSDNFGQHQSDKMASTTRSSRRTRRCQAVLEIVTHATEVSKSLNPFHVPPQDSYGLPVPQRKNETPLKHLRIKRVFKVELVLRSVHLRRLMKKIVKYYPSYREENFRNSLHISEPYAVLMHHYESIEGWICEHEGHNIDEARTKGLPTQIAHMKILRDFLRDKFESTVRPSMYSLGKDTPVIGFDSLWFLFKPGQDVYAHSEGELSVFVVQSVENDRQPLNRTFQNWLITCWGMATNGYRIARSKERYQIRRFAGLREVLSLPVCPASIWDAHDGGLRRKKILERNKLHLDALRAGSLQVQYEGKDLMSQRAYRGKIIIDHKAGWDIGLNADHQVGYRPWMNSVDDGHEAYLPYDHIYLKDEADYDGPTAYQDAQPIYPPPQPPPQPKYGSRKSKKKAKAHRQWDTNVDNSITERPIDLHAKDIYKTSDVTEHQLLLLRPVAPAFALSTKQWMRISIEYVQLLSPSHDSINKVVLADPDALKTIRALSARQNAGLRSWSADFIEGKGSGQIILLHGPPGVGKTYTVESIAAWLKRPLLALTVADIGTVETRIESELLKYFDLAESWNAVLLVDEADIFLEQRKNRDLARNGLVSAFLRRMEYFKGLLFLTTNRVGQIDDAFMSRVHVAIGYEPLTTEARKEIWQGFFTKLEKERKSEIKVGLAAKRFILESEEVRKIELNGREIRNALQTAITLAEYETLESGNATDNELVVVEEAHFRSVLSMTEKFHNYVTSIRREDERKRAAARGDRNDYED